MVCVVMRTHASAQVFKNQKYLEAAERAAALVWRQGLTKKGVGLCHGVSGNGYLMLRLAAITESAAYDPINCVGDQIKQNTRHIWHTLRSHRYRH